MMVIRINLKALHSALHDPRTTGPDHKLWSGPSSFAVSSANSVDPRTGHRPRPTIASMVDGRC